LKNQASSTHFGTRTLWSWGALLLCAGLSVSACGGVSDVETKRSTGGTGGAGGLGSADSAGNGNRAGAASTDGDCEDGARRCAGDTPQACAEGKWKSEQACSANEACSGGGVCAAFRLVGAGIGTFGKRPAEPVGGGSLILKEQTLSAAPRVCSTKFCITGDVR
jgi:hypothetical protein